MAKDVAVFPPEQLDGAISCLLEIGFSFENPDSSEVSGWGEEGRRVFRDASESLRSLQPGICIQLWKSADQDLAIGYSADEPSIRIYFDGYSVDEAHGIQRALSASGIDFAIEYE